VPYSCGKPVNTVWRIIRNHPVAAVTLQAIPEKRVLKAVVIAALSFTGFIGVIAFLWTNKIVGPEMGILMLVALFGLYFGFGVLIAVYRLVSKLE